MVKMGYMKLTHNGFEFYEVPADTGHSLFSFLYHARIKIQK